ncbi:MAG: glutamate synthase central domain-containing protein, partial [SAR324 cluster bacterium]|nr:glutamate synthase central domain-containing protein [SAR324 cluster bacterium]
GRRPTLASPLYDNIRELQPIIIPRGSDSACMDNVFEFLIQSGYSLPHAMMMMVPEAWEKNPDMNPEKQAFYEFHDHLMEPWDGPASLTFTDGVRIGATLDRNGLRPSRYVVTKDDFVIMGSEVGAVDVDPENIKYKGRLQPGKMFLVDTEEGRIIDDAELKKEICSAQPYAKWLKDNVLELSHLPKPKIVPETDFDTLLLRQKIFGYTTEDLNLLLTPMVVDGVEASGSMGNDTPLAVLSDKPRLLYDYFKQIFAQVSNPPVDAIREELVMSLTSRLGPQKNILEPSPEHARMLKLEHPVLSNEQLAQLKALDNQDFYSSTLSMLFDVENGVDGLAHALSQLCRQAENAVKSGSAFLVLSDRGAGKEQVPIPALLAVAAVHHHLILKRKRYKTGIIVETGEAREIAHFCLLVSYGAGAINPYLAFETFEQMIKQKALPPELTREQANENYLQAIRKGMYKVFSKMGISTIQSYRGAQIFEAIGLNEDLVHGHFSGTPSRINGVGIEEIAQESLLRHGNALEETADTNSILPGGGFYNWRRRGEFHQINPVMSNTLQNAVRKKSQDLYDDFSKLVNDQSQRFSTPRSLFEFAEGYPILLDEVEPAAEIVKRFVTGAMSFGSISIESHETLAVAMNRIGGRSNSGEGGEDPR